MDQVIIFPINGMTIDTVAVIHPAPECELSIADIARKDVPQGIPYLIMEAESLPQDRTFRAAWTADFATPDGHGDPIGFWADQEGAE